MMKRVVFTVFICLVFLSTSCAQETKKAAKTTPKPKVQVVKKTEQKPDVTQKEATPKVSNISSGKEELILAKATTESKTEQKTADIKTAEDFYSLKVEPLKPVECARCHITYYRYLQKEGGKHRKVMCTDCHKVFHAYSPKKKNWSQIMPKCSQCHKLEHGKRCPNCLSCHRNPHTPKNIPISAVKQKCNICHSKEALELKRYKSKHTLVGCIKCHKNRHGYIPECAECHKPHVPGQKTAECLSCHPVHSPKRIKYAIDTPKNICGSCHETQYEDLKTNITKHSALTCAKCHPKHGYIKPCVSCHGKPHSAKIHKMFPKCVQCHIDPHNMPIKELRAKGAP